MAGIKPGKRSRRARENRSLTEEQERLLQHLIYKKRPERLRSNQIFLRRILLTRPSNSFYRHIVRVGLESKTRRALDALQHRHVIVGSGTQFVLGTPRTFDPTACFRSDSIFLPDSTPDCSWANKSIRFFHCFFLAKPSLVCCGALSNYPESRTLFSPHL